MNALSCCSGTRTTTPVTRQLHTLAAAGSGPVPPHTLTQKRTDPVSQEGHRAPTRATSSTVLAAQLTRGATRTGPEASSLSHVFPLSPTVCVLQLRAPCVPCLGWETAVPPFTSSSLCPGQLQQSAVRTPKTCQSLLYEQVVAALPPKVSVTLLSTLQSLKGLSFLPLGLAFSFQESLRGRNRGPGTGTAELSQRPVPRAAAKAREGAGGLTFA